jgi:pseudouridine kinase
MQIAFSKNPDAPVLVIGAASVDIVGRLRTELKNGTSNPAHIRTSLGGVARNVAENLARLGQPVNLLTVVGEDENGDKLLQHTADAGVNIESVLRTSNHPSGCYLGVLNTSGELQMALDDMRALSLITPGYLRQQTSLFQQASLVFMDANLSQESLKTVVSLAHKHNLPICADPTSAILAGKLQPHLGRLHLITPNYTEAAILAGHPVLPSRRREAMQAAKALVGLGVKIAIIALAEFGVCYATSETAGHFPAIRTSIVDPTGAGDAQTATVLFALLNHIPIDDAVRLGVSAASLTLSHLGTVYPELSLEKLYDHLGT